MSGFFSLALYSSLLLCTCLFWYWATKRLRYRNTEERAPLNRSRTETEAEDEEADTDSPATEIRQLQQPGSFSNPRANPDVGGSSSSSSSGEGSKSKFHVFISHRGPDTKRSLAYHLYDMLVDRGIQAFLDREELQSGESLTEAIKEAIECCKVQVCILSSGFAESMWCLKELVMMLRKCENGTCTLIPVFYDLEPSDVRRLKGNFGKGFQKLISNGRYSGEEIDEWRNALYKIAQISGHEGQGDYCRTIVNQICELLDVGSIATSNKVVDVGSIATSNKVVGIEQQVLRIISYIMNCRQNGLGATLVEISGMGGIGKTTFAKELYNKIYSHYDRYCFIEDVNRLVEKHGKNEIHRQLISRLFRYDLSKEIRREVNSALREKLHNAEILVVLDNIHRKIPLSSVFIDDDVPLSPRSIIIVTSREGGVLKHDPEIQRYHQNLIEWKISNLDFYTSKKIFCQYTFAGIEIENDEFNELTNKIVGKCHGIPLALTTVGKNLYREDIDCWKSLWNSIKDSLPHDVKDILKFSYDNLGELEKCLFLDIATILLGEKEKLLVELRRKSDEEDAEFEIRHALNVLKKKDLIHVSYDGDGVLYMHDVFVDLGRSIVKDEDSCPGRRSRVWDPSDVKNMLSDETGTEKVKALNLVFEGLEVVLDEDQCPWFANAFSNMSSLEILIAHGDCIEGDLSKLSKRLLYLKWTDFPYHEIPGTWLKHLRVLHVTGEQLTLLWEHSSSKDAPAKLRQLHLMHCSNLQKLPESMGKLRQLSFMDLSDCTSLEILPDSFGRLYGLKDLRLTGCHALKQLPDTFGDLTRLHTLKMTECFALVSLPETFGGLTSLVDLTIKKCSSLVSLPQSIGKLLRLDSIGLYKCTSLESIPDSFGQLQGLKDLSFCACPALKRLPETFGGLRSLVDLSMERCSSLVLLPAAIGQLPELSSITLHGCTSLEFIPDSFGQLQGLKFLDLMECPSLKLMPETFEQLTSFSFLKMPGSFRERLQLTELNIVMNQDLKGLPHSLPCLTNLYKLNEEPGCCKKNFSIEPHQGVTPPFNLNLSLTNDHNMELAELENFEFWKNYSNWNCQVTQNHLTWLLREVGQAIQKRVTAANLLSSELELIGIYFMKSAYLSHEMRMNIDAEGFWNLSELPQSLGNLRHLKLLNLINCYNIQKLPESVGSLSCLTNLALIGCLNLEELPESVGSLSCLTYLALIGCLNLEELPNTIGNLQNLAGLRICTCLALKGLPSSLGNLSRLESLKVEDCLALEGLPSSLGNLSRLESLKVEDCWMVEEIQTQALFSLKYLAVCGCFNLRRIIGPIDLSKLENMIIEGCFNLREIMVRRARFNKLNNLSITGCYQLTFPKGLAEHLPLPYCGWGRRSWSLSLSLNHDMFSESYSEALRTMLEMACYDARALNFKSSPALFLAVQEQVRKLVSERHRKCVFRKLPTTLGGPSIPFILNAAVLCFTSAVYTADLPKHVPPPTTTFDLSDKHHLFRPASFRRFDFGEEIHFAVLRSNAVLQQHDRDRVFDFFVTPVKEDFVSGSGREGMDNSYYPSYEALVKEGWLIFVDGSPGEESVVKEICNIIYSEVMKQRCMTHAWTHLPSQLSIHDFSALDIAGCQITKISRHCNTCIMEEETGLTWNRGWCIFKDDHALLLKQRKCSKHSFLPQDGDLESVGANLYEMVNDLESVGANLYEMVNLYEMPISMLVKGKVVHSRKLQEFSPETEEKIPYPLKRLLQERAFHSTFKTLHKMTLGMLKRQNNKYLKSLIDRITNIPHLKHKHCIR